MGLVSRQIARAPLVCLASPALEPSFFSSGCERTIFETSSNLADPVRQPAGLDDHRRYVWIMGCNCGIQSTLIETVAEDIHDKFDIGICDFQFGIPYGERIG